MRNFNVVMELSINKKFYKAFNEIASLDDSLAMTCES